MRAADYPSRLRFLRRHRSNARLRAIVKGATVVPARGAIIDLPTALIAAASLVYLLRLKFKVKEPALVFATGALGPLLHGVG